MAGTQKTTHFGRAGEYFAMSELLLRGWNVAVPVVDVGDDVFVINDRDKTTWRVQVKSAQATSGASGTWKARFNLSRAQLSRVEDTELFYMLMIRQDGKWRSLVIPREVMFEIHTAFVSGPRQGRGRKPVSNTDARTDKLGLDVTVSDREARGWNGSLTDYLDTWPSDLPLLD